MSQLISQLFSTSSTGSTPPWRVLSLRPSPNVPGQTVIHPLGYPADVPPLYTIAYSKTTKPNVAIFQGSSVPSNAIGNASFHSISSTTELSVRGQSMRMTMNHFSGNFTLEIPTMGKFKWSPGKILGSSLELRDRAGIKLAHLKSGGFPGSGERKLEIYVACDEAFVDLMVLSGMAAKTLMKEMDEAAAEVAGAVAGI